MMTVQHGEILGRGVDVWNDWRMKHRHVRPDLSKVNLSGRFLFGVDLSEANLRQADLRDSDLFGVDLAGADLRGADLRGAKLDRVIGLKQEQLDSALGDQSTQLPNGAQRPSHWFCGTWSTEGGGAT